MVEGLNRVPPEKNVYGINAARCQRHDNDGRN